MNEAEIKQECKKAFERTGMSKGVVADYLHTVPSNISNWLDPKRSFPIENLMAITKVLNDYEFTFKAIEYTTGLQLLPKNGIQAPIQNDWFSSKKEEDERKCLEDSDWFSDMSKEPKYWTVESYKRLLKYRKELSEEAQAELLLLSKISHTLDLVKRINNFSLEDMNDL